MMSDMDVGSAYWHQKNTIELLETELAASQAREKVLLDKLKFASELIDGYYRAEIVEMEEVINMSSDDTALKAERAAERERCALVMERQHTWITNVAAANLIRALGDQA